MILNHTLIVMNPNNLSTTSNPTNPGFSEAFFLEDDLNELLDSKKCNGIRFYNILEKGKVKVMAVAIKGNKDFKKWSLFNSVKPYYVSEGLIAATKIKKNEAKEVVDALHSSSMADHYSAHFDRAAIQYLLNLDKVDAIRITPADNSNGHLSMKIEGYSVQLKCNPEENATGDQSSEGESSGEEDSDSGTTVLFSATSGAASSFIAPTPCPPYCGFEDDYVSCPTNDCL